MSASTPRSLMGEQVGNRRGELRPARSIRRSAPASCSSCALPMPQVAPIAGKPVGARGEDVERSGRRLITARAGAESRPVRGRSVSVLVLGASVGAGSREGRRSPIAQPERASSSGSVNASGLEVATVEPVAGGERVERLLDARLDRRVRERRAGVALAVGGDHGGDLGGLRH